MSNSLFFHPRAPWHALLATAHRWLMPLAVMLSCSIVVPAGAVSPSTDTARLAEERFSQSFNALLKQHELPGAVVLIKKQGQIVHFKAYGKLDHKQSEDMKKDAVFRIFSMSKPITAFALLQLVDQGKVGLHDDIRRHLPQLKPFEYAGKPQVVTVHQILTHTAGLGYGGGIKNWIDLRYLIANPLSPRNSLKDLVDDLSGIELKFIPGKRFHYSIASDLQGAIIEAVTKMPLDKYLQSHIFDPLQMKDTGFYVPEESHGRLVDMYEFETATLDEAIVFKKEKIELSERAKNSKYLKRPALLSGGGGLVSTAADYSNFVTMLENRGKFNGRTLLSGALVDLMLTSHISGIDKHFLPKVYPGAGFGYGIGVMETPGQTRSRGSFFWAGLGGTLFWSDPSAQLQVIAMMQVEDGWIALDRWMTSTVYQMFVRPQ